MVTTYAPSLEAAIHNHLVTTLAGLECPDILTPGRTAAGEGSVLVSEDQTNFTSLPSSVTARPLGGGWEPSRNCGEVSRRTRWTWEVKVDFPRLVFTDQALKSLARSPLAAPTGLEGVVLRLTRDEITYRPLQDSEQGTTLRLTFESISNR
jgi:hypothetical protein